MKTIHKKENGKILLEKKILNLSIQRVDSALGINPDYELSSTSCIWNALLSSLDWRTVSLACDSFQFDEDALDF